MNNDLTFAVNTNWDLFEHAPSKTFYLRHESQWLKAASVSGPWTATGELPASFAKLPAEEGWKDVHAALPKGTAKASTAPTVFVSTVPAELILLRGAAAVRAGARHEAAVGSQHRLRCVPARRRRVRCTTWSPDAGSRRRTSPARGHLPRSRSPPTSRRFRSSTSAHACWPRSPAPRRPLKRSCSRRCRRRRA